MADLTDGQLIGLITLGMGVIAFFAVLEWRRRTLRLYRNGLMAVAEVRSSEYRSGEHGSFYRIGILFTDISGEAVYARLNLKRSYKRGEEIRVIYDPDKPTRVDISPEVGGWNPDGGLFAFGIRWLLVLIFVVPGLAMILFPFGDPICDDPTFRDMTFCVEART